MGLSKSFKFSEAETRIAAYAKAIAHPARVAILDFLTKSNECFCGDIVAHVPLAQATVSQHLQVLKSAGLIKGTIKGPKTCYCISQAGIQEAKELFNSILAYPQNDC